MKVTARNIGESIAILAGICLVLATPLANKLCVKAQQPAQPRTAEQAFKNIKVIKSMPANQLQNAMQFMSGSLGVDCSYCHTPPAMEKDDKPTKETARRMLVMVSEINKNFESQNVVNCATCHHGNPKPISVSPLPSLSAPFALISSSANKPPLPSVDEILDRYVKELGGMPAVEKTTTRMRKGSVDIQGLHGTFELYEAAPNKFFLIGSLPPPFGSVQQGFDGSKGWVKNQSGIFDMSGDGLAQAQRDSPFYRDFKLKGQFKSMSVTGKERIDSREFYVVQGTRPNDSLERLYFDTQTGLLVRRYWETPTYFGPLPNVNDYDDYRKVGNVRLPFLIRKARAGTTFVQTISEYKMNLVLEDEKFKKPAAQK